MIAEIQPKVNRSIYECYLHAWTTLNKLNDLGFLVKKAGISVPVSKKDAYSVADRLTEILGRDMRLSIPHYFFKQTPERTGKPGYITRTITSAKRNKGEGSIVEEQIVPQDIVNLSFVNKPPYCLFQEPNEKARVGRLFIYEITEGHRDYMQENIVILAGIGKSLPEVKYGFDVMTLAMISAALVDWGSTNPQKPLYIITTARLTNAMKDSKPSAYLLNRLYEELGLNKKWLGLVVVHRLLIRDHWTGAVIVKILPSEYENTLEKVRSKFNQAVEKMRLSNPSLFDKGKL
jgi:hypothetical protein